MLLTRRFIAITVVNFFAACNLGAFYLFPLFLADHGGTSADIGYIMGAFPLASVLSRPLMWTRIDPAGPQVVLRAGASTIMITASLAYLAFSGGLGDFSAPAPGPRHPWGERRSHFHGGFHLCGRYHP